MPTSCRPNCDGAKVIASFQENIKTEVSNAIANYQENIKTEVSNAIKPLQESIDVLLASKKESRRDTR